MKVAVITSIYGGYDTLKEPVEQTTDAELICITDDDSLTSPTWKIEPHTTGLGHPRLRAKVPKFMPWLFTDADFSIWVDGSAEIVWPTFVEQMLSALGDASMAQFRHPSRDCIYDEAEASEGLLKYELLPLAGQVESYRILGHPEHWGLWATGVIVRRHDDKQKELGAEWLRECNLWTYQDQLSEPFLLRRLGIDIADLPHGLVANPWLAWHPHASER